MPTLLFKPTSESLVFLARTPRRHAITIPSFSSRWISSAFSTSLRQCLKMSEAQSAASPGFSLKPAGNGGKKDAFVHTLHKNTDSDNKENHGVNDGYSQHQVCVFWTYNNQEEANTVTHKPVLQSLSGTLTVSECNLLIPACSCRTSSTRRHLHTEQGKEEAKLNAYTYLHIEEVQSRGPDTSLFEDTWQISIATSKERTSAQKLA